LDWGWQHLLRSVFSQQAADEATGPGVDEVAVMIELPRECTEADITRL
jgi:hypothetical protein